ncbi:MAG: aminodeoxychorismate lyase, partial [Lysobacteraceae bacterium]
MKRRAAGGAFRRFLLVVLLAGLAVAAWKWQDYRSFAGAPMGGIRPGASLVVERGDSLEKVLRKLDAQGLDTGDRLQWQLLARQLGAAGKLQVGEYELADGTSPRALLEAMRDGKVVRRMFTIVEGWNIRDLRAALAKVDALGHEASKLDDVALMKALGAPGRHPEGRFLPETYAWVKGDSDLDILRRAYAAMDKAL